MPANSAAHRSWLPKSRSRARASGAEGASRSPNPSKWTSCRTMEFQASSSSRFSPFTRKVGAAAMSSLAKSVLMAPRRLTAPA